MMSSGSWILVFLVYASLLFQIVPAVPGNEEQSWDSESSVPAPRVRMRVGADWPAWGWEYGRRMARDIPVHLLTHTNVAYAYIDSKFQVHSDSDVSSDVLGEITAAKARNSRLKMIIELSGWQFGYPNSWQSVFSNLVSSRENRATFIHNLFDFLSEAGYDGVNFDWELPTSKKYGGSDKDGENYTALLRELRAEMMSHGHRYIVTFTAPASRWYLRQFDLKAIESCVDWINLMTYDLNDVWESDFPTQESREYVPSDVDGIDIALNLFWNAGVEPSSIVIGLSTDGKFVSLTSDVCSWPMCHAPFQYMSFGLGGRCEDMPWITTYRETRERDKVSMHEENVIKYIVSKTDGWRDHESGFTLENGLEYVIKRGLSGVAISGDEMTNLNYDLKTIKILTGVPFSLAQFEHEFLDGGPRVRSVPENVTLGGRPDPKMIKPDELKSAYFQVSGDSYAVSSLRHRQDGPFIEPEPFIFLDCPSDVLDQSVEKVQVARIVCFGEDLWRCSRLFEGGVEGTIVEMPDNCARNHFARAVSVRVSQNQNLPNDYAHRLPSTQIFDFLFDFNFAMIRTDTDNTKIHIGYDQVNDKKNDPHGHQRFDNGKLGERYLAPFMNAVAPFANQLKFHFNQRGAATVRQNLTHLLFNEKGDCVNKEQEHQPYLQAFIMGNLSAEFTYGVSMMANMNENSFNVDMANGSLQVDGEMDTTMTVGGLGKWDISRAGYGNPALLRDEPISLPGYTMKVGHLNGWISFEPYYQIAHQLATRKGVDKPNYSKGWAYFFGMMRTRVITDLGNRRVNFPYAESSEKEEGCGEPNVNNKILIDPNNVVYGSSKHGGTVEVGISATFGLKLTFFIFHPRYTFSIALPDMVLAYDTVAKFGTYPGRWGSKTSCSIYDIGTTVFRQVDHGNSVNWDDIGKMDLGHNWQQPAGSCYPNRKKA